MMKKLSFLIPIGTMYKLKPSGYHQSIENQIRTVAITTPPNFVWSAGDDDNFFGVILCDPEDSHDITVMMQQLYKAQYVEYPTAAGQRVKHIYAMGQHPAPVYLTQECGSVSCILLSGDGQPFKEPLVVHVEDLMLAPGHLTKGDKKQFLDYEIKYCTNNDGIVLYHQSRGGYEVHLGNYSSLESAEMSAIIFFMIARPHLFSAQIHYRCMGRPGAYQEYFAFKKALKAERIEMPLDITPVDGINNFIGYKGKLIKFNY